MHTCLFIFFFSQPTTYFGQPNFRELVRAVRVTVHWQEKRKEEGRKDERRKKRREAIAVCLDGRLHDLLHMYSVCM